MPMDGYVVPSHHGLVRLRPSSGGSVEGEDEERMFNHTVIADLDDELANEISLIRQGKAFPVQSPPHRRAIQQQGRHTSRPAPHRPAEKPTSAPGSSLMDGYSGSPTMPAVKTRPERSEITQPQADGTPYLDMLLEAAEVKDTAKNMLALQHLWESSSSNRQNFQGTTRPLGGYKGAELQPPPLMNREGFHVPFASFVMLRENGTKTDQTTDDLFRGRRVVVFSGPGAFHEHYSFNVLPRYDELAETFRENGVNAVYHISINDAFALEAWRKKLKLNNIIMLPDGAGHFAQAMGMLMDAQPGRGRSSWRYSMLIENGEIKKMFIEPHGDSEAVEVSDADSMLNYLNPNAGRPQFVTVLSREGCASSKRLFQLLDSRSWKYEVLLIGDQITRHTLHALAGATSTPQVFLNGRHVGGTEEMERYVRTVYGSG